MEADLWIADVKEHKMRIPHHPARDVHPHHRKLPGQAVIKTLSSALVLMMLTSLITLVPAVTGGQQALAEGEIKLALEIAHVGLFIYEVAAFGGETAYEQLVPDPDEELLDEVKAQGALIDEVQEGLDQIQADLADMFQELNLYDCMQNAWNTIPAIQNYYSKLNYDIGDQAHGTVSEDFISKWAFDVTNGNFMDTNIAQWYTALVLGGVGNDQNPVLLQMRDFALDELNGNSVQSDFSTTVESTNGVGIVAERPMYFDYAGAWTGGSCQAGITNPAEAFYFAEGTVRPDFNSYICVQNPNATQVATVCITYMKGDGTTAEQNLLVQPQSRSTVNVNGFFGSLDGPAADFSAKVESTNGVEIVAERPMYFNYGGAWTGGHVNAGVTSTSTTQYFAEGTTRPGFDSYLCIQNPETDDADISITYMKGDGSNQLQQLVVPALSRSTIKVNDVIGYEDSEACDFSAMVESTNGVGVVAERPMYFAYKGDWTGGHCQNGARSAYPVQYFAEGTSRPGFDPYLCIQNPGANPADVTITYMKGDGSNVAQPLTVPPLSRSTVTVKDLLGEAEDDAHDFSAKVECTNGQQIIAERPMYFNYRSEWTGGHDEAGLPGPAGKFYFAEGTNRPGFDSYICIQNPEERAAQVKVTFMKGDGSTQVEEVTIPASSRYTMAVGATYDGATLTDAYERYLASFFSECLYYQAIGAISVCNAKDYQVPKTSSDWLKNTYLANYIKKETDLFWSCTEQLVMAAADTTNYDWNKSQQYLNLPAEAADIFSNADLLRKIAMGQIGLPESGNVVSAGICGRIIGAQDAVPNNTIPAIKVKAGNGTTYNSNFSEAGTIAWLSPAGAQQKYDTWTGSGTMTLGLCGNWSTPRYQFDGPTGGFADGNYSIINSSGATIGTATVSRTAFPDPRNNANTLYLSYGDFTSTLRNKRLSCDPAQWKASMSDDGDITSKMSTSFTEDLTNGAMGIWLSATGVKDTYYQRTYTFTSNSFTTPSNLQIKVQDGLKFNVQSSGGQQESSNGYVYSHFGWYRDEAHGYMKYELYLKDSNGTVTDLDTDDANAHSDSGDYTKDANFGTTGFTNTHNVTLTGGHTYTFVLTFYAYIKCDEGGVTGSGGDAEANQLLHLTSMGVMAP
jgi:hypothetical protein